MRTPARSSCILPFVLLLGCRAESDRMPREQPDAVPPPPYSITTMPPDSQVPPAPVEPLPRRASVRVDSVRIEGDWQRERLTLVESPPGFSPPFSTYVPEGLRAEFDLVSDTAAAVRFIAAFAGKVNRDAYLQVRVYRPDGSELLTRNAVEDYLLGRDPRGHAVQSTDRWPWSIATWHFHYGEGPSQGGFLGSIGITRHGNRYLHVLMHYPADYGDGVGPRFQQILAEWRWEDDGERLVKPR